ncbi:MAG: AAA domain-containing protein [Chloroflexota bacterium]
MNQYNLTQSNPDTEAHIRKLVATIKKLMPNNTDGWVKWRKVAKEQEGSEEYHVVLSALATLDEWKYLFANNGHVVKLSEDGIKFSNLWQGDNQLSEIYQIANSVKKYASRLERINLKVNNISKVARVGNKYVQAVYLDVPEEETISSETPVEFLPNAGSITHGKIVGQEPDGGVFYIAFDNEILETSLPARLSIDPGYLLHQLAEKIEKLPNIPPLFKSITSNNNQNNLLSIFHDNSIDVATKLANLQTPWARYLWGPPGAGKTFALCNLVLQLIERNFDEQVLIFAPSNRAVDVVVQQLVNQIENSRLKYLVGERKILRFGYPRKSQILERSELLGPPNLDNLTQRVKFLSLQILKNEREKNSDASTAILRAEMLATQEEIKNAVATHIRESKVVATTSALAYLPSSPISTIFWDNVMVDEVTMVTPATCAFIASLAQKRFLLTGDPRQLGPIYKKGHSATKDEFEWMGRDIFDKGSVSSGEGENRTISTEDYRLSRITSQRRCDPNIWSIVSRLYPEVKNLTKTEALQGITNLPPSAGSSVVFLDTSNSRNLSKCENRYRSWQNQYTAELSMEVACTIAAEKQNQISIAIISPYRAQVKLLRKWIKQEQQASITPYKSIDFEAGTVHQFQGSDADVVIFDMVDGVGRQKIGSLLRGDTGIRLVNVAITRAKGKFIIIADKRWCEENFRREENPLLWDLVLGSNHRESINVAPPLEIALNKKRHKLESPIEELLFEKISTNKKLAKKIQTQYIINGEGKSIISRADFAFPDIKYAVYCDGKQWHLNKDRWQRDWRQRNKLTELGWIFSVFTGSDVHNHTDECVSQIEKTYFSRLENLQPNLL